MAAMGDRRRVVVGRVEPNPDQLANDGPFARTLSIGPAQVRSFATANVFYRRGDLAALGGFDPRFRRPAGEDTDLGLRAERDGAEVVFDNDAFVWHDVEPGGVVAMVRDQARWSDLALVFAAHPQMRRMLLHRGIFWKPTHGDLLLLLAGLAGVRAHKRSLLLALPWLHRRLCAESDEAWTVLPALPGLLAVDVAELVAMVRGSVKHRTLIL
jgi:hypothetical protein